MGISIDSSFAIQIVSFLVLWAVLQRFLFVPILRVLSEREERTRGNAERAERLKAEADGLHAEYDERMHEVRRLVFEQADQDRKTWREEERGILAAARDEASDRLAKTRVELATEVDRARSALSGEARELASRVVGRILGSAVG